MRNNMRDAKNNWKKRSVLFLVSQCITLFGSTLVQMAVVWHVTLRTSSGVWVAAFSVCSYLPQFLISFAGGVWADRYHRKKLIILSDAAIAVITLAMFYVMQFVSSENLLFLMLLIMSALRSLGAGVQTPAVNAVIPQIVPKQYFMRYNSINAAMQSVVQFAAPAAAGVVLSLGTLRSTLLIDVVTAAFGIGILSCVWIPRQNVSQGKSSLLGDMKSGIGYAFLHQFIGRLLIAYGLFIFLCVPAGFMNGLLVRRVYGDTYLYLTVAEPAGFAGMAVGGIIMGTWGGFKNRVKTLRAGLVMFGSMSIGMGIARNFTCYLSMMVFYGVALTMVQTAITTLIQEKAETAVQGRVFGLMGAMYAGFLPVGMAIFGPLADVAPMEWIMVGAGVGVVMMGVVSICTMQINKNN